MSLPSPEALGIASQSGHEIKLEGTRSKREGKPCAPSANVTDAAMVKLICRYLQKRPYND